MDMEEILHSTGLDLTDAATGVTLYYDANIWCVYQPLLPKSEGLDEYSEFKEFKYAWMKFAEILGL